MSAQSQGIPSDQILPGLVEKKNNIFLYFNTNLYYRLQNRLQFSIHFLQVSAGMAFSSFSDFFYGFNRLMARSPERIFEFWKHEKVTESQIWRIRWISNDFCFV